MSERDVVVIGGGHNGLVAAALLARAGRSVLVCEGAPYLGGAVRSEEVTRPGFVSDVFSMNQNTFLGGPAYAQLGPELERQGLRYARNENPFCNAFPDGTSLRVYANADRTLEALGAHHPGDAEGWRELGELFDRASGGLFEAYGTPLTLAGLPRLARVARRLGAGELLPLAQLLLLSTRALGDTYFATEEAKALVACWGMHLDFGPDVSGGALFPFLECFADQAAGMSIVEGGASGLIDALAGVLRAHGGEARTDARVERIVVEGGRATGVELAGGERVGAREAVVASVTPTALVGGLLPPGTLPEPVERAASRYRYGPGTLMLHLALSGPPRWAAGDELSRFAYVHIAPYVRDLAETYAAACEGLLPRSPMLVVGQPTAFDPTRAPEGAHVLWVQVRAVPARIRGDAAGEIEARTWPEAAEPVAHRVMAALESYAPGIGELVLDRAILTPADLEARDPNLVGGCSVAGSHHLNQNFVLRPLPTGAGRRVLDGLVLTGAATWPGGGVTGVPGLLAAQAVLDPHPVRDAALRAGAIAAGALGATVAGRRLLRRG